MKKVLFLLLVAVVSRTSAMGQEPVAVKTAGTIMTGGKTNASTLGNGSATATALAGWSFTALPLYSKIDTFTGAGVDTMVQSVAGWYNSVYTWVHVNSLAGTNTSVVVKLWASGDGLDWGLAPVYQNTVAATGNPYGYVFTGWPYSQYKWTVGSGATQTSSWYGGLRIR